jgi:hypothetical protein
MPTDAQWWRWEQEGHNTVGFVCGTISGNLLVIDFDKQGEAFNPFMEKISAELRKRLVIEQSPSGGFHIYARSELPVAGNTVLAWDTDGETRLIETRGEGGFIVCCPSPGYTMTQGDFNNIPVFNADEVELLLDAARSLDRKQKPQATSTDAAPKQEKTHEHTDRPQQEGDNPWDWFAKSGEWRKHLGDLEALGWVFFEKDGVLYFQTPDGDHAPGKQDGNIKDGVAYIFSRAPQPFNENEGYRNR